MHPILRRGSKGPDVKRLQQLLNEKLRPSPNLKPDGDFGPATEKAVRAFQTQARLGVDGVVGTQTWSALEGAAPAPPSGGTTIIKAEPAWMKVARGEIGQKEIAGAQHNPRIIQYHATTTLKATTDETAWCASFVNWVLKQAGVPGTNSAAAASWLNWGVESQARVGAIVVIYNAAAANSSLSTSGNHVGFLIEETPAHYSILGGNQSDQVKISNFSKSKWRLKGYRWPRT
ncbi:MAG TPA: TIGR02594 family protein [Gemmatales bacterium]|nr:TIGR02594 family protein [Gemmatales bacterium]HMP60906.1 TIGR02594 family protein [Gemmatales bacterium]